MVIEVNVHPPERVTKMQDINTLYINVYIYIYMYINVYIYKFCIIVGLNHLDIVHPFMAFASMTINLQLTHGYICTYTYMYICTHTLSVCTHLRENTCKKLAILGHVVPQIAFCILMSPNIDIEPQFPLRCQRHFSWRRRVLNGSLLSKIMQTETTTVGAYGGWWTIEIRLSQWLVVVDGLVNMEPVPVPNTTTLYKPLRIISH